MSKLLAKSSKDYIHELFKHLGFKNFDLQIDEAAFTPSADKIIHLALLTRVNVDYLQVMRAEGGQAYEVLKKSLEPILNDVENSPFVKSLTHERDEQIKKLNMCVMELRSKVAELEPFKTHYDLQFKMTHGKDDK